jgi:hypothetical protein
MTSGASYEAEEDLAPSSISTSITCVRVIAAVVRATKSVYCSFYETLLRHARIEGDQ